MNFQKVKNIIINSRSKSFRLAVIDFIINKDTILVSRGYLDEIKQGLMMILASYINSIRNSTN